jgi:hypothetical protein
VRKLFSIQEQELGELCEALNTAIVQTYDEYHRHPEIFKFTHAVSFCRYLATVGEDKVQPQHLMDLDRAIDSLITDGVTERSLHTFLIEKVFCTSDKDGEANLETIVNLPSVREFLLHKLESGEHTPDDYFCVKEAWKLKIEDSIKGPTIAFYNEESGRHYTARYGDEPMVDYVARIDELARELASPERNRSRVGF